MTHAFWEHFHHGADIGVRGRGDTLAAAFEQAAMGLTAVITDPNSVNAHERVEICCQATDSELLLTDWLNAIIYEMAVRRMLFSRFDVSIQAEQLHAIIWGETIDRKRHQPGVEVKGATYTELLVQQLPNGVWIAQCVVDV